MIEAGQIDDTLIETVVQCLQGVEPDEETVAALRREFPGIHLTWCMDDDVMAEPVFEGQTFNLYLVDSREHCVSLTQDMGVATGLVVAGLQDD